MPSTFFQRKTGGFYVSMQEKLLVPPTWKCHLGDTFPSGKAYFSKITTVKGIQFEPSCAGNLHFLGLIIIL